MLDGTLIWLDKSRLLSINALGEGTEISVDEALRFGYKLPDKSMIVAAADNNAEPVIPKWEPGKPYQTTDWHASLLKQENFLTQKKRLMLYRTVKTKFSAREALQGFYGSMLELTYTLDDHYWATRTKGDIKRHKAGVWDMLREYNLDEKSLEALVRQTTQAFDSAVKEFNIWNDLMFLTKLDKTAVGELINFISNGERIAWLRGEIESALSALDVETPPKNLGWLFRWWHILKG